MGRIVQIRWRNGAVELLDQTLLPKREVYKRVRTVDGIIEAIYAMRVRGAPLIGITAAYGMVLAKDPKRDAKKLIAARPTAVNLRWAVERMLRNPTLAEARLIHREDEEMCERMGRHGARLLGRGVRAMTICNTGALATGGIGTAFGVLLRARARVYALETRPVAQGARLTMWEAKKTGLNATLIADGAAGSIMRAEKIGAAVAGADRIAANGDTANKIGTYPLALLCLAHGVPFYIAAPSSTFDPRTPTGRQIPIEERDPAEVLTFAPRGAKARNPAFDVTPAGLIRGFITEKGIIRPPFHKNIRSRIFRAR